LPRSVRFATAVHIETAGSDLTRAEGTDIVAQRSCSTGRLLVPAPKKCFLEHWPDPRRHFLPCEAFHVRTTVAARRCGGRTRFRNSRNSANRDPGAGDWSQAPGYAGRPVHPFGGRLCLRLLGDGSRSERHGPSKERFGGRRHSIVLFAQRTQTG